MELINIDSKFEFSMSNGASIAINVTYTDGCGLEIILSHLFTATNTSHVDGVIFKV